MKVVFIPELLLFSLHWSFFFFLNRHNLICFVFFKCLMQHMHMLFCLLFKCFCAVATRLTSHLNFTFTQMPLCAANHSGFTHVSIPKHCNPLSDGKALVASSGQVHATARSRVHTPSFLCWRWQFRHPSSCTHHGPSSSSQLPLLNHTERETALHF